jgi:hypothetical protein
MANKHAACNMQYVGDEINITGNALSLEPEEMLVACHIKNKLICLARNVLCRKFQISCAFFSARKHKCLQISHKSIV